MTRVPWDMPAYGARIRERCYVCALLDGTPGYEHHVVHRDDVAVVYLSKYPWVRGHLLVAPVTHVEHVTGDLDEAAYVALQRVVHRAGRALTSVVETERLYVLSLGSQQGNRHVHVHLVPLPPGVPYERQQAALMTAEAGWLDLPGDEQHALAQRIAAAWSDE